MLFFEGLAEMLEQNVGRPCAECRYRDTYGMTEAYTFGGVFLCIQCKDTWRVYVRDLHTRTRSSFPEIGDSLRASRLQDSTLRQAFGTSPGDLKIDGPYGPSCKNDKCYVDKMRNAIAFLSQSVTSRTSHDHISYQGSLPHCKCSIG